jgi:hypothetical protein
MSYELIEDYQCINSKKQICVVSKGTKISKEVNGFFEVTSKKDNILIEKDIVVNNPQYFKKIDLVTELADILKKNKKSTAPKLAKIVSDYFQELLSNSGYSLDGTTIYPLEN